jgi:hypothetical protein
VIFHHNSPFCLFRRRHSCPVHKNSELKLVLKGLRPLHKLPAALTSKEYGRNKSRCLTGQRLLLSCRIIFLR